jgi:hypothetical protein
MGYVGGGLRLSRIYKNTRKKFRLTPYFYLLLPPANVGWVRGIPSFEMVTTVVFHVKLQPEYVDGLLLKVKFINL